MTREEAAEFTRKLVARAETIVFPKTPKTINNIPVFYFEAVLSALRSPQPDPETGLMPCGCGGKAEVGDGNKAFCGRCGITTLEQFTQEDAKSEWNRAMGVKGADE